jgi:hypothetical protein
VKFCAYEAIDALSEFIETGSTSAAEMAEFLNKRFNVKLDTSFDEEATMEDVLRDFVKEHVG